MTMTKAAHQKDRIEFGPPQPVLKHRHFPPAGAGEAGMPLIGSTYIHSTSLYAAIGVRGASKTYKVLFPWSGN